MIEYLNIYLLFFALSNAKRKCSIVAQYENHNLLSSFLFSLNKLQIHRIYRSSGASMSKAQQEFTTTFLRNEHVQTAAGNVAASAVRAQMQANTTQPRY